MNQFEQELLLMVNNLLSDNQAMFTRIAQLEQQLAEVQGELKELHYLGLANSEMIHPTERSDAFARYQNLVATKENALPGNVIR